MVQPRDAAGPEGRCAAPSACGTGLPRVSAGRGAGRGFAHLLMDDGGTRRYKTQKAKLEIRKKCKLRYHKAPNVVWAVRFEFVSNSGFQASDFLSSLTRRIVNDFLRDRRRRGDQHPA